MMVAGGGLMIGGAKDPAEAAADARANRALAAAPKVHRKCAACEDAAHRSAPATTIAPGARSAAAPKAAKTAVDGLGPGRPLSTPERSFYEQRLGADFSGVRLHENATADRASRALDAAAFTLGRDIAFASGERSRGGASLMAHELAHVAEEAPEVRRKLRVKRPNANIARPGGKGLKQTNGQTVQNDLDDICFFGGAKVKPSGQVTLDADTCGIFRGLLGTGCDCLCDIISSKNAWTIEVRDTPRKGASPHSRSADLDKATGVKPGGSGGEVVISSPNDPTEYGMAQKGGGIRKFDLWEILSHELCGHARLSDKGAHEGQNPKTLRHGHEAVVAEANKIRAENDPSLTQRGASLRAPFCGESFFRKKGSQAWTPSRHLPDCKRLRAEYLKEQRKKNPKDPKFKKKFKVNDQLP